MNTYWLIETMCVKQNTRGQNLGPVFPESHDPAKMCAWEEGVAADRCHLEDFKGVKGWRGAVWGGMGWCGAAWGGVGRHGTGPSSASEAWNPQHTINRRSPGSATEGIYNHVRVCFTEARTSCHCYE